MIFEFNKYRITSQSNRELIISMVKNYVIFEIVITIIGCALLGYFLSRNNDFSKIGVIEIGLGFAFILTFYNLFRNLKVLRKGEVYIFNSTYNSITRNNQSISALDQIDRIQIIEHDDSESSNQYELQVHLKEGHTIYFQKTTNLGHQKQLGEAISGVSGVPFNYKSREELWEEEYIREQEIAFQINVKRFEEKYKDRSNEELKEIVMDGSSYADYAKQAARNLLDRKS